MFCISGDFFCANSCRNQKIVVTLQAVFTKNLIINV